jgi:hypothetical protein
MDNNLSTVLRNWAKSIQPRVSYNVSDIDNLVEIMLDAANEIDRLQSGGCARDQKTTQYCGEAVALQAKLDKMHLRMVAQENAYDVLQNWNKGVEADNDLYRKEYLRVLEERDALRSEILQILSNHNPMFSPLDEKQRRNWR